MLISQIDGLYIKFFRDEARQLPLNFELGIASFCGALASAKILLSSSAGENGLCKTVSIAGALETEAKGTRIVFNTKTTIGSGAGGSLVAVCRKKTKMSRCLHRDDTGGAERSDVSQSHLLKSVSLQFLSSERSRPCFSSV